MAVADTVIWNGAAADNDYDAGGNFVANGPPIENDAVIIPRMAQAATTDITVNLGQSAVALWSFDIDPGCFTNIGVVGIAPTYLEIDADTVTLSPEGIVRLDIDNATIINVLKCKSVTSPVGSFGLFLRGTGNDQLNIGSGASGDISIAALAGESAAFTVIRSNGGRVTIGDTVTMTTLVVGGGTLLNSSAATTMTVEGGTVTHEEGAVTNMYCNGGTTYMNAVETIGAISARTGATLDFSKDLRAKTITDAIEASAGCVIRDPYGVVSNMRIDLNHCKLSDITLEIPPNKRITIGAVA